MRKDVPAVETIEAFRPWFVLLMERLAFVWIYAAGNAYNVREKPYTERFNPVPVEAKGRARARWSGWWSETEPIGGRVYG